MKILPALLCLLLVPLQANARVACRNRVVTPIAGDASKFVKLTFTPKCSANADLHYLDDGVDFAVQSASAKGKTIYGVSTASGGVIVCSTVSSGAPRALSPASGSNPC